MKDRKGPIPEEMAKQGELQLYTHPALLLPSVVRSDWTAEMVAQAFAKEFKDRLVPCGVLGMTNLPVELESGYWKRSADKDSASAKSR